MDHQIRKIQVASGIHVSSAWAVPDNYRGANVTAIILAHGAGNGMDHPFISHFHLAFAEAGLLSVKFNFPYKELGRKAPDRMPLLESTWRAVVRAVREDPDLAPKHLFLAGKSMGGRVASRVAAQGESCSGLIFLGYPLHPARQVDKRRTDHWPALSRPVLFVQGTRDALCDPDTLRSELPRIAAPVTLHIVEGGDHSFNVPKSAGRSQQDVLKEVGVAIIDWMMKTGQ